MTKKFSHSVKKYIAGQKALIRRQNLDVKKQEVLIAEIYTKLASKKVEAAK